MTWAEKGKLHMVIVLRRLRLDWGGGKFYPGVMFVDHSGLT